jgi:hypothetical protein
VGNQRGQQSAVTEVRARDTSHGGKGATTIVTRTGVVKAVEGSSPPPNSNSSTSSGATMATTTETAADVTKPSTARIR